MSEGWSHDELKASVQAYHDMQRQQDAGLSVVKAAVYRELAARFGRVEGAFERRMQNISAIYQARGGDWVSGLKPQHNIGAAIKAQLIELIDALPLRSQVTQELAIAQAEAEQTHVFDDLNAEDARTRVVASIVRRQGQPAFRRKLLAAYGNRCAITGCDQPDVLEAAHIRPYNGQQTNVVSNGLLLRADVHTLFDLYLIAIDPDTRLIHLSPTLSQSGYGKYHGMPLHTPSSPSLKASAGALKWHAQRCDWFKSLTASSD